MQVGEINKVHDMCKKIIELNWKIKVLNLIMNGEGDFVLVEIKNN
jgi:hypothetical protein